MRRLSALNGYRCTDEERVMLQKSLETPDYISSEESAEELVSGSESDEENNAEKFLMKRPLVWRSDFLNHHYQELDRKSFKKRKSSRHGGAASYIRKTGPSSSRDMPEGALTFAVEFNNT